MTLLSTQLISVVQNLGFPIAAFLLMYNFATKTLKENTVAINNLCLILKTKT